MLVFRICSEKHSDKLTSSGAANRWNNDNEYVIYTGANRALSTLEFLAHLNLIKPAFACKMLLIDIPDTPGFIHEVLLHDLPADWRDITAYPLLQEIGSNWYVNKVSPVLKVPSAIIPQEHNYIINTSHPDFKEINLQGKEDYFWDDRLFNTLA